MGLEKNFREKLRLSPEKFEAHFSIAQEDQDKKFGMVERAIVVASAAALPLLGAHAMIGPAGPYAFAQEISVKAQVALSSPSGNLEEVKAPQRLAETGGLGKFYDYVANLDPRENIKVDLAFLKTGLYAGEVEKGAFGVESMARMSSNRATDSQFCQLTLGPGDFLSREFSVRHEAGHCLISSLGFDKTSKLAVEQLGDDALGKVMAGVRNESHADAYAILSLAVDYSPEVAARMGKMAVGYREQGGAFSKLSGYDTEFALEKAIGLVESGYAPKNETEALFMAAKIGDESMLRWMQNDRYFEQGRAPSHELHDHLSDVQNRLAGLYSRDAESLSMSRQESAAERLDRIARVEEKVARQERLFAVSMGGEATKIEKPIEKKEVTSTGRIPSRFSRPPVISVAAAPVERRARSAARAM